MVVNGEQNKLPWSTPGLAYGVDSVSRSTGIRYADSFYVDMHTRFEAFEKNKTKLVVITNLVWEKQTIFKSKIETETINSMKKYFEVVEKELSSSIHQGTLVKIKIGS